MTNNFVVDYALVKAEIARLDREINERRHVILCLREEISDLEVERCDLAEVLANKED